MIRNVFIALLCLFAIPAFSRDSDCLGVHMAGTGEAAGKTVRFLKYLGDSCIVIQALHGRSDGTVITQSKLCRLEGKSMSNEYTDVDFKMGGFHDGKLYFEIGVTQLKVLGEEMKLCEVVFVSGRASHLKCENGKSMSDIRPPLFVDYF